MKHASAIAALLAALVAPVAGASAQSVESFYSSATITISAAGSVGGSYDLYGRTLEPYLRKYLPGTPTIIDQAMPGGGGTTAANYIYNLAPKDGTAIGVLLPTVAFNQAVGQSGIAYDAAKFGYLGTFAPLDQDILVWRDVPARTIDDARKGNLILGASGKGSSSWIVPTLMNQFLGTKFKIVNGYTGIADIGLAIMRGEVQGTGGNWAAYRETRSDWIPGQTIFALAQSGLTRNPAFPDTPTMVELAGDDAAKRAVLEFYSLTTALGIVFVTTPGTPPDRLAALQAAFDKATHDPDFRADAETRRMTVDPSSHGADEDIVKRTLTAPPAVVRQVKDLLGFK